MTARSSPGALHTVGQSVRAHGGRDEFTGAERRGVRSRSRYGVCRCSRRMHRSAACASGRCRLAPPGCRELGPRCCTRPRARACCSGRWRLSCRRSPELARAAPRGRAHGSTAGLPCRLARNGRPGQVEKLQRESCAAWRDGVWCGRCSRRRCVWPARCGPCAGAGHGLSSRSLPMSFAHYRSTLAGIYRSQKSL